VVIALGVLGAYTYEWKWTGFLGKTLWDWMKLLLVPAMLALGGLLITQMERISASRGQRLQEESMAMEREIARQQGENAQQQLHLSLQRQQDEQLQTYLDRMTQLLVDRDMPLRQSKEGDEVRMLARAWTLTMLGLLKDNAARKSVPLQFLQAAGLIVRGQPVVSLAGADLSLADLSGAQLDNADLSSTDLRGARLHDADLSGADLSSAYLGGTWSRPLSNADLRGANLSGVEGITNEELEAQAASLEGATMPNGQKYEDWLKAKEGHREDRG
jgi:hypothetical protein